jgi:hypothetical protein
MYSLNLALTRAARRWTRMLREAVARSALGALVMGSGKAIHVPAFSDCGAAQIFDVTLSRDSTLPRW